MNPLVDAILDVAVEFGPEAAEKLKPLVVKFGMRALGLIARIVQIWRTPDPTESDWGNLFAEIKALDYDKFIADAQARANATHT